MTGFKSELTRRAQKMLEMCAEEMGKVCGVCCVLCEVCVPVQCDKELEQLEAEINPTLADDPQVALTYLFTKAIETMKSNPEASWTDTHPLTLTHTLTHQTWIFHEPVPAKNIPDYYKIIRCPMDLGTMTKASSLSLSHLVLITLSW